MLVPLVISTTKELVIPIKRGIRLACFATVLTLSAEPDILVKTMQPENASVPILVTLSGIVMLVKPVQPLKAELPMLVTLSGIIMLVKPVQL